MPSFTFGLRTQQRSGIDPVSVGEKANGTRLAEQLVIVLQLYLVAVKLPDPELLL